MRTCDKCKKKKKKESDERTGRAETERSKARDGAVKAKSRAKEVKNLKKQLEGSK